MRIQRHPGLHVNANQSVAPVASWDAGGAQRSFESALSDQRQRVTSNDKTSPQQRSDARLPSRSNITAERSERQTRPTSERASQSMDRPQPSITNPCEEEDSPIPTLLDRALAARWRRVAGAQGAECIEVVHAATGSKFLLSRDNGIWLLTIQSRAAPEDDDAIVLALRELFSQRGLGPLDVIKV